jgi:hypothetical protein
MPTKQLFNLIFKGICLLLSGMGVGWLIGLSVSPVIHIVITSLIAFVVSITGALAGLKVTPDDEPPSESSSLKQKLQVEINPVPVMLIVIGIAFGASLGVYGRTNNWLGTNVNNFVAEWEKTRLGEQEISKRLFETLYPAKAESTPTNTSQNSELTNSNSSDSNSFERNLTEKSSNAKSIKSEQRSNEKKDSSQKTESLLGISFGRSSESSIRTSTKMLAARA